MAFEDLLEDVLKREGGFTEHPSDPGRATKFGITQGTLSAHRGREVDSGEVAQLTLDEAKAILRKNYLEGPGVSKLPSRLVPQVFDMAVNMGPQNAIRILQRIIGADEDGILGPQTLEAARLAPISASNPVR